MLAQRTVRDAFIRGLAPDPLFDAPGVKPMLAMVDLGDSLLRVEILEANAARIRRGL